jgi:hypothetical protein
LPLDGGRPLGMP